MIAYCQIDGLTISLDGKVLGEPSAMFMEGDVFRLPESMRRDYFEGLSAEGSAKKQKKLRGLLMFRKATTEEIVESLRLGKPSSKFAPPLKRADLDRNERQAIAELVRSMVQKKILQAEEAVEKEREEAFEE